MSEVPKATATGWYCVHIAPSRALEATKRTFVGLLKAEPRSYDLEADCRVYGAPANDNEGYCYFFSPDAVRHYRAFVKFWRGFEFQEPQYLKRLERII